MTLSGHVTSSESCPIDCLWPLSYRLSIGTIPLSGFVSEILAPKLRQRLLRDDVINDVIKPVSTIREKHIESPYTGTLLKYRPIPIIIAGEEAC